MIDENGKITGGQTDGNGYATAISYRYVSCVCGLGMSTFD